MNMKKIIVASTLLLVIAMTNTAFAAVTVGGATGGGVTVSGTTGNQPAVDAKLQNPINVDTFDALVQKVIEAAVQVLTPFVVLAFIYSGFLFVKARGNTDEIAKAKTAITYSFVGAVILLGAWGFAQIIGQTVTTITGQ